jgi:hypothetical protein
MIAVFFFLDSDVVVYFDYSLTDAQRGDLTGALTMLS